MWSLLLTPGCSLGICDERSSGALIAVRLVYIDSDSDSGPRPSTLPPRGTAVCWCVFLWRAAWWRVAAVLPAGRQAGGCGRVPQPDPRRLSGTLVPCVGCTRVEYRTPRCRRRYRGNRLSTTVPSRTRTTTSKWRHNCFERASEHRAELSAAARLVAPSSSLLSAYGMNIRKIFNY